MIKNNKGFVVTEILILSTIVMGILIFMFIQFKNINRSYQYSFEYDTVPGMYLANNIINYINKEEYDNLVNKLSEEQKGYLDITNCDVNIFRTSTICTNLIEKSEIEQILFTEENLEKIKHNSNELNEDIKKYINQIKTANTKNDYRIIIKYKNNTFANMRFNKGNAYVEDGLIVYLDGINNTGNGHLNDAQIWKDLSNHGNDATLYNNPTWNNNSLTFDGLTNYARIENTTNMEFPNGITLETRINIKSFIGTTSAGNIEFIGSWQGAGLGILYTKAQLLATNFHLNGAWQPVKDTKTSNINEYYTLIATYDNNNIKLYINGEIIGTSNDFENINVKPSPVPISLGGNAKVANTSMDNYANVEFQNVLIYDRALTEKEVLRNYQADMARY